MANTKSAIKRIRKIATQTLVNKARKSKYRNAIKKMNLLLEEKKKDEALKFLPKLNSELMKVATFINSEFNFGKNFRASSFFFSSRRRFIFFIAFLYLLLRALLTSVCVAIFLILLIADFVFAISAVV